MSKIDDRLEQYTQAIEVGCCVLSAPPLPGALFACVALPPFLSLPICEMTTKLSSLGWEPSLLLSVSPSTA